MHRLINFHITQYPPFYTTKGNEVTVSARVYSRLKKIGIQSLEDLTKYTPIDIYKLPGIGKKSLKELISLMHEFNISW